MEPKLVKKRDVIFVCGYEISRPEGHHRRFAKELPLFEATWNVKTELSPPAYVGTALTTQTCAGFALTTLTIWLIPPAVAAVGWRWAFATLAVGPLLGVVAMARLRATPEAARLAGGRR